MRKAISLGVVMGGLLAAGFAPVWAQINPIDATDTTDARALLEARKRQQAAQFDAQDQDCAKTFAVTDCVSAVNVRRRAVLAALRKEENALNDAERRQRERERLQNLQQKEQQQAEQAPAIDTNAEFADQRLRRQQDKLAHHGPQSAPKAPTASMVEAPIDAPTRQKNAADYATRQQAANERRAARDKKLKEQGNPAKDLPTPP